MDDELDHKLNGQRYPDRHSGGLGNDGPRRRERGQAGSEPAKRGEESARKPDTLVKALMALDLDLMKLLVQRSGLVSRLRRGKDDARSARAVQDEKAVRLAWEENAVKFSKDPRFSRELFVLLQDLKILTKAEADKAETFLLAPPLKPVDMDISGPGSDFYASLWLCLGAGLGQPLRLGPLMVNGVVRDFLAAFKQCGMAAGQETVGAFLSTVSLPPSEEPLSPAGKSFYVGDSFFSLCLFSFWAVQTPGVTRFSGGPLLKRADLSPLCHVFPLLGARFAHLVPRSHGLPAVLESSGLLPDLLRVPADLPGDALCALLAAALIWRKNMRFEFSDLPSGVLDQALARLEGVFSACSVKVHLQGLELCLDVENFRFPHHPPIPLDPILSAYLLAMPAFVGGTSRLQGMWFDELPEAAVLPPLLRWAGLQMHTGAHGVWTQPIEPLEREPALLPDAGPLPPALLPLYCALCIKEQRKNRADLLLPLPLSPEDLPLANELFRRVNLFSDGTLLCMADAEPFADRDAQRPSHQNPWACPTPYWGLSLALTAFARPGLRLLNPQLVSGLYPAFWNIFNSLPSPFDPAAPSGKEQNASANRPSRRRIIAG